MPGYEFIGKEEQESINSIFRDSNGVFYRYGFDELRNGIYRVKEFESNFAEKFNVRYAHAVSSGSAALKCSLRAMGIGEGDEVIIPAHTFIATAEAVHEVGATPIVVSIDNSLNMSPLSFENSISLRTKAVIPVHMLGAPCDLDKIIDIAERNNILVLEDNAQAPGGKYKGKYLGTFGDIGIFSFDGGKMLTTGEGGMIVTDNKRLYRRARGFSDHGHADTENKPRGEDDCLGFGFNYKMTELQGAIGLAQLKKMDNIINEHKKRKKIWKNVFKNCELVKQRIIHDEDGDISDSFSIIFTTKNQANEFVREWNNAGYGTKNLPDAMKWHFAGYWRHINMRWKDDGFSYEILSRTVTFPINGKTSLSSIEKQANKALSIIKNMYEKRK